MNPLLNHTINELSKPNANTAIVLADAFSALLLQAKSNKRLNLCGGEYVDKNTAIPMQTKDVGCNYALNKYKVLRGVLPKCTSTTTSISSLLDYTEIPNHW